MGATVRYARDGVHEEGPGWDWTRECHNSRSEVSQPVDLVIAIVDKRCRTTSKCCYGSRNWVLSTPLRRCQSSMGTYPAGLRNFHWAICSTERHSFELSMN